MSIPRRQSILEKEIPNRYLLVVALYCFFSSIIARALLLNLLQAQFFAVVFPSIMMSPAVALLCASYIYKKNRSSIIISAGIFSLLGLLIWAQIFSSVLAGVQ